MQPVPTHLPLPAEDGVIVTEAVLSAADRLGISGEALAGIIGVSPASVSRMRSGAFSLAPGQKTFDLALLLVRLYRSLDAIVGGDRAVAAAWMRNPNTALGGKPIDLVRSVLGLADVIHYLDARRAQI